MSEQNNLYPKKMTLSEELKWRGLINQTTYSNFDDFDKGGLGFYLGVDPSAKSMHIGQLAMMMLVRHLVLAGHKATLLVGGATGLIGDPDGKLDERDLKSINEIESNKIGILTQFEKFFGDANVALVDNYDWFSKINYIDFLREVGKKFSMSQMLDRDFVKNRIGEGGRGISYAEFSYSLIQGYDFLHLYREKNVVLQVSGADQWGNSLSGVQLVRQSEDAEVHVLTAPLVINKSTGKKFGKSEGGAIWLNPKMTSPYDFYQFLLNTDDESVLDYVKLFTEITPKEYDKLHKKHQESPRLRLMQKYLAYNATKVTHSEEIAKNVEQVVGVLFGGANVKELEDEAIEMLCAQIPSVDAGKNLIDCLVESGVVRSRGEVKRLLTSGGVSVDGEKISDDVKLTSKTLVKRGKNKFLFVK